MRNIIDISYPVRQKAAYFFDQEPIDQVIRAMYLQQVKVLDIGCGVRWTAFELEREYGIKAFTCLDKMRSEREALEAYPFFDGPGINQFKSFSDLHYSMNHQYIKASHQAISRSAVSVFTTMCRWAMTSVGKTWLSWDTKTSSSYRMCCISSPSLRPSPYLVLRSIYPL